MATIQIKRNNTSGVVPVALADGELACNTADGTLFVGNGTDVVEIHPNIGVDLKDPSGFVDNDNITVTYNSTSKTVTVTHADNLFYFWQGIKKELGTGGSWTSPAHPTTLEAKYYLYSVDGINFTWSITPWNFYAVMIAFVWHGTADKFCIRECHGLMPWTCHEESHRVTGTYKESGGTLSGYVLASTTATNRRPLVAATIVHDEDIKTTIPAITNETNAYTTMSLSGAGAVNTFTKAYAEIVPVLGNNPYYNTWDGAEWIQTLMANNSYMSVWLFAAPMASDAESQSYRYAWVQGQTSGNLAQEQAKTPSDLNLGQLTSITTEGSFIGKIIIRYTGGNWQWQQVDILSGSRALYVGSPAGAYLASVFTDETMGGDGSVTTPLGVLLTADTTPVDSDMAISLRGTGLLKTTWTTIKTFLKTYFDTIYQAAGEYLTSGGALGTPSSGNLANCTFPTLNQNTTGTAAGLSGNPNITVASATFGTNITSDTIASAAFTAIEAAGIASREHQKTLKQRLQTGTVTIMQSSGAKADAWTWSTVPFVAVTLPYNFDSAGYTVLIEVVSFVGNVGVVTVENKTTTGFKVQHNGNANSVVVNWIAIKLNL